ncbi:hypothetical protein [Patulibacter defluvii]|uniref:hypothetical protein n=1 Tax=Patulibacter defluvii TaxID=3095358 RepID=UPI002A74814D|nr:hypothetical protein [Patulibacter sp. DM4]
MPPKNLRAPALAAACVVALALGGCGSSDSDDDTTAASTTAATTASTATTTATTPTTDTATTTTETTATGTTTTDADPTAKIDPCSLLTDDDVTGAGGKAGVHRPDSNDVGRGCNFGVLSLYVGEIHPNFTKMGGINVDGLGDEAFYRSDWHDIRVRKGDVRVDVRCTLCSGDEPTVLKTLAGQAVGRLPAG